MKHNKHTLSLILWKSRTLSEGILHTSHSRYHFFSFTGFPIKLMYFKYFSSFSGSKSPSSAKLLFVSTSDVRFGSEMCSAGETVDIWLLARRRVLNLRSKGKFASATIELSVKSMASCWSWKCAGDEILQAAREYGRRGRTLVTPRFSMAGIL